MHEASWWLVAVAVTAAAGVFCYVIFRKRLKSNSIPGPIRLPIIGHCPLWGKVLYRELEDLAAKYGDIVGLHLGRKYCVVLSDFSILKQALSNESLKPFANGHVENKPEVEDLKEKDELIKEEVMHFLEEVEKCDSEPLPIAQSLINSAADVICDIIHTKRLEKTNTKRKRLREAIQSLLKHVHPQDIHIPFSEQELPTIWDADKLYLVTEEVIKTMRQEAVNGYSNDHVILSNSGEGISIEKDLTTKIDFLLQTASSSIVASIEWTLLAIATQPDVQEKCIAEIDAVIGRKDFPEWKEHHHLPYTIATCMEAQRLYCVHPIALVKQTTHDIHLGGHHIPKDSFLLSNVWTILHDPMYWLAPDQFHPERFLSSNRKEISRPEFYIPLSYDYSGNTLAELLAFVYVVSILQRFTIQPYPVDEEPDMDGRMDIVHRPYLFEVQFFPRE